MADASGRPDDTTFVIPAFNGNGTAPEFTQSGPRRLREWIDRVWRPTLERVGIPYQRPYDLRHSYASLLFHEGRSVVYVARQVGHSTAVCMRTYGHVIEELEDAPRITAEDAIRVARVAASVRQVTAEWHTDHGPAEEIPANWHGRYWARTSDLLLVRQALYQLS